MTILDTSIWVAYLNTADSQHARASQLFRTLDQQQLILPEYIILEVATILAQRASKKTADQFLEYVLDNQDVTVLFSYRELFGHTVEIFQRQRRNQLSFVDAALVALSDEYTVHSFDRALARAIKAASH